MCGSSSHDWREEQQKTKTGPRNLKDAYGYVTRAGRRIMNSGPTTQVIACILVVSRGREADQDHFFFLILSDGQGSSLSPAPGDRRGLGLPRLARGKDRVKCPGDKFRRAQLNGTYPATAWFRQALASAGGNCRWFSLAFAVNDTFDSGHGGQLTIWKKAKRRSGFPRTKAGDAGGANSAKFGG